jgi:hypothetical protein
VHLRHAFSVGATHLGTLGFVVARAAPNQSATAQGYLAIALGTTMAGATALSGLLFAAFGSLAYTAMALMAVFGAAAGYAAHRMMRDGAA